MERTARRIALLAATAATVVTAAAASAPGARGERVLARAEVAGCRPATSAAAGEAVFRARMRAAPGTRVMAVRFQLLRAEGSDFVSIPAPGLDVWRRSEPGVARFVYNQKITNLEGGSRYRVLVRYRWYGSDGRVIKSTRRASGICGQPDVRPDLVASRLASAPGRDGATRYLVAVVNAGRRTAPASRLRLTVGAVAREAVAVPSVAGGAHRVVAVEAPACAPGSTVGVQLDVLGVVEEIDEANNTRNFACPSRAG